MDRETRRAVYDRALRIEAYRLQSITRPFPAHFHEHYVIGLAEAGRRTLRCRNQEYAVRAGDVLLFNPGDSHACTQRDGGELDYRGLNIAGEVMLDLAEEVTGIRALPVFSHSVIRCSGMARLLRSLHELLLCGPCSFEGEETLLLLISALIQRCGQPLRDRAPACRQEIEAACSFMERHYAQHISLEQICRRAGLSKSALLRAFARGKGITPYRYLETIRISRARELLEQGVPPAEAALRTGFSDQSHFTNCFSRLIGMPPGGYQDIFL